MKILLKNLLGKLREEEVTPETTVESIKKLLESEYDANSLKLCYKGAVVDNEKTMAELDLEENPVFIIAGTKRKNLPPPKPAKTAPLPEAKQTPVAESASVEQQGSKEVTQRESATTGTEEVSNETAVPRQTAETSSTTGAAVNTAASAAPPQGMVASQGVDPALIDGIVAMGFEDREQVALALRAAYMNSDRAVEFLCTGIPESALQRLNESYVAPSASLQQTSAPSDRLMSHMQHDSSESPLYNALMQIPQFGEIRSIVQANPESLPAVLQQIRIHHPEVIGLIQQDPEEFLRVMGISTQEESATGGSAEAGGNNPAETVTISLREGERGAIERLVELGGGAWTAEDALQAYRACDDSEEAAAHFLFSNFLE